MTIMRVGLAGLPLPAEAKQELTKRLVADLAPVFSEDRQGRIRAHLANHGG